MLFDLRQVDRVKASKSFLADYIPIKEANPDFIIFFQIGKFYETFFQDAKVFSEVTGATLGCRHAKDMDDVLQAGVNTKAVDFYIKKMLSEDFKVCVCNETKDENGNIRRKVVRRYTRGTIIENELLDSQENNYILALSFFEDICYLSYADVSTGQFYKTQGDVDDMKLEIEKISPNELLVCKKQFGIFKKIISDFNVTVLDDSYFYGSNPDLTIFEYCKEMQKEYLPKFDEIIQYKITSYLTMDEITRRNLELTRTRRLLKKKGSVMWFLNYTKTAMGTRLLKKYIDEPLLNLKLIKLRQDAVEELILNNHYLTDFENTLEGFCDLSRMCAKISNSTIRPKDLYQLVKNSQSLEELYNLCFKFNSELLKVDEKKLLETMELVRTIERAINNVAVDDLKSGGIINDGYNAELDYKRDLLKNIYDEIEKYQKKEIKRLGIEKLKIDYSKTIGYYIEIPSSKQSCVPNDYFKKQALSNCVRYTSEKLKELEEAIYNLKFRINEIEYELYCDIRARASKFVDTIRDLAKDIARIDVLSSYSRCAIVNNLVRPHFNSKGIFIEEGFHPSLLKLKNDVIKNDTSLSNGSMIILTGANMSGKSTYLKHNAIICLLSQMGSFIPARAASLSIIDKIFLRQGSTDDIINNNSSFMVEMNDLKFILDNITNTSFVLLDEPAKSTNAKEGGAIARAFCEYLLNHYDAKIILTTHNAELTKLEEQFVDKVTNYVIGNSDESLNMVSDRKIKRGVITSSLAINTAMLANLPSEIIESARAHLKT